MARLPLIPPVESRDGTSLKDGHMTNVLIETEEQGTFACVRPAIQSIGVSSGSGAGVTSFNGLLIVVFGGTLQDGQLATIGSVSGDFFDFAQSTF